MTKRQLLEQIYQEAAKLRIALKIQGMPNQNLFENGLGWDGDLDHELLVIADGLGGATLKLLDQDCLTHHKRFTREDDALNAATRLLETTQGLTPNPQSTNEGLTIDSVQWDPA